METFLKTIDLSIEELKYLPLFCKIIYYNEMSNLDDENSLMMFNKQIHTVQMRHFEPSRIICKNIDTKAFKIEKHEVG